MVTIHPCCKLIRHAMDYQRERGVGTRMANANKGFNEISRAGRDWKGKGRPRRRHQKRDNSGGKRDISCAGTQW